MIILKNITYIDHKTFKFVKGNLLVEEGKNKGIRFVSEIPEGAEIYDYSGKYAMRSFVVGHHHIYSGLVTQIPGIIRPPLNFFEILDKIWWRVDRALNYDMIRASAYAVGVQAIRSGAGFIIDHHSSPSAVNGSLKIIQEALDELGLNYLLSYEISDRNGEENSQKALEETYDFLNSGGQALVGLHASFTLGDKTLKAAADLMEKFDTGIHIHTAEDHWDTDSAINEFGFTVLERLNEYSFLDSSKTILAHGIHFTDIDFDILNNSKAFLVQNPESNLNNRVGFLNVSKVNKEKLMLGTDGMHSDMLRSAHSAYYAGQAFAKPSQQMVYEQLVNNWNYLEVNNFDGIGDNNILIFDYMPYSAFSKETFLSHFFFKFGTFMISDLLVDGKFVMKDREILAVDEKKIAEYSRKFSLKLVSALESIL